MDLVCVVTFLLLSEDRDGVTGDVETLLGLVISPTGPTGVDFIFSVLVTSGAVVTLAIAEEDPIVEELDIGEDFTVDADVIAVLFDI